MSLALIIGARLMLYSLLTNPYSVESRVKTYKTGLLVHELISFLNLVFPNLLWYTQHD